MDDLQSLVEKASQSVGRLDGLATVLPDTQLFIYMFVRKEAVAEKRRPESSDALKIGLAKQDRAMPHMCRRHQIELLAV